MSIKQTEPEVDSAEVERLRERVAQLEDQLASLQAWANGVVAEAQKRVYWLDRLHLDLDPIMRHVPVDFAVSVYQDVRDRYYRTRARAGVVRRFVRRLSS